MQLTVNQLVVGSIPAFGAKFCKCQQVKSRCLSFFEGPKQLKVNGFNSQPLARVVSVKGTVLDRAQVISIVLEVRLGGR